MYHFTPYIHAHAYIIHTYVHTPWEEAHARIIYYIYERYSARCIYREKVGGGGATRGACESKRAIPHTAAMQNDVIERRMPGIPAREVLGGTFHSREALMPREFRAPRNMRHLSLRAEMRNAEGGSFVVDIYVRADDGELRMG